MYAYDRYLEVLNEGGWLYEHAEGDMKRIGLLIAVGTVAEAWFTGPVAESYPVQATAKTIVIVGTYDGELPEPPGLAP